MKVNIGKYPKKGDQKINVRIDPWDTWSMDNTLAHIIVPMLKQLRDTKHGSPWVDDEDVPAKIRSTKAPKPKQEGEWDNNVHKRWDYVLGEMIFAFEAKTNDWEDQFYSGNCDFQFIPYIKDGKNTGMKEMVKGPKDTFKVNQKAKNKFEARMKNGFRLFGKYYEGLWD